LKYGAWSNGASEFCGFLLLPIRGTEARTSFLLETGGALTPEFNTAVGAVKRILRLEQKQAVSPHTGSLLQTVIRRTLAVSLEEKEFGDGNP